MYKNFRVAAIIPALNEEKAIAKVVKNLHQLTHADGLKLIDFIIVCDNGSTDNTAAVAKKAGATIVEQYQAGYGIACLTAIRHLPDCDVVLFVDGDDSCFINQAINLLEGIAQGDDVAIGSRSLGRLEKGALTMPQQFL